MKHIKYFIHDILCLDKIDDKTISEIFVKDKHNALRISYCNLFSQKRLKEIIKINHIHRIIFKKECPILLLNEICNNITINNIKIINSLVEGSFKKFKL